MDARSEALGGRAAHEVLIPIERAHSRRNVWSEASVCLINRWHPNRTSLLTDERDVPRHPASLSRLLFWWWWGDVSTLTLFPLRPVARASLNALARVDAGALHRSPSVADHGPWF
jgi:hypothetical protein